MVSLIGLIYINKLLKYIKGGRYTMKKIKQYKTFTIKEVSERDDKDIYTYKYYIFNKSGDIEWESDLYKECIDWIDSY